MQTTNLVTATVCKNNPDKYWQNHQQCIGNLFNWKDRLYKNLGKEKQRPASYIVAEDMKAFFPNLCREVVSSGMCLREAFHLHHDPPWPIKSLLN